MNGSARRSGMGLVLALLVASSIGLTGCWDRQEVNDLALVMGAGLDLSEDNKLELSVQIFVAKQAGDQQGSAGGGSGMSSGTAKEQTTVYTATGDTIADAATKLQELLPRKVFWGHGEVFVFGEQLAKHGITDQTDFLMRHPGPRLGAFVFVSKGKAKDVMARPSQLERNISEGLREMAKSQTGLRVNVKELMQMLKSDAGAEALPLVSINKRNPESNQSPFISGTAVLKDGKMVGQIDEYTTRGIMWLRNSVKESVITFKPAGSNGFVSAHLNRSKVRLIPSIRGDEWSIRVQISSEANLIQNESGLDPLEPRQANRIQEGLNDEVSDRIESALAEAQRKMDADIFGFSDTFRRSYPKQWERVKKNWSEKFPQVRVDVSSDVRLKRPGFSGK
ncbi:Ger(x)C family spore germination protein [Cohnella zeiphila]|uniref:Ger(X)C family spore germination protein n=1 Tax=Cohnella zeiphila TaxID=2761120 RepID=A0A7X0SVH8_9BACL|nr:Ger(x)C family spore germination protein [Cohnella zeiphila]